jgi:hypothetical protein
LRQPLQPGRNIHAIPEQVAVPHHRFTHMDADPEHHPAFFRDRLIDSGDPLLDGSGTLDSRQRTGEFRKDAITRRVGNATAVVLDLTICDLAMGGEQTQGATLIHAHEAGVANDIGAEDRRKATLNSGSSFYHLLTVLLRRR